MKPINKKYHIQNINLATPRLAKERCFSLQIPPLFLSQNNSKKLSFVHPSTDCRTGIEIQTKSKENTQISAERTFLEL